MFDLIVSDPHKIKTYVPKSLSGLDAISSEVLAKANEKLGFSGQVFAKGPLYRALCKLEFPSLMKSSGNVQSFKDKEVLFSGSKKYYTVLTVLGFCMYLLVNFFDQD